MGFTTTWGFRPAPWTALSDQKVLDTVLLMEFSDHQGAHFENPEFELKCVLDARSCFAVDLFQRILLSDRNNEPLVLVLPSPENPAYISVAENLNKFHISCRNVHVFFFDEYANGSGEVAPWQSPYSRSGQWMKYFYQRLRSELAMPLSQVHFWTKDNVDRYSELLAQAGGADVIYSEMSWTGLRNIDAESFSAKSMEEFCSMGSRIVTPMLEQLCMDSLRGMFGCSGDISNVPPRSASIGPKDILSAKKNLCFNFLSSANGGCNLQKPCLQLAMFGPLCPENPGSILRLTSGICYVSAQVSGPTLRMRDENELGARIDAIRRSEEACQP